jgi:hypothetical protein
MLPARFICLPWHQSKENPCDKLLFNRRAFRLPQGLITGDVEVAPAGLAS